MASGLLIYITTNRFKNNFYAKSSKCQLPFPTAYTPIFIKHAEKMLEKIYKSGFEYKKAGIEHMLDHIRNMPNKKFQFVKNRMIGRNISRLERHSGIMTQKEKQEHAEKLEAIFEKVRNISEKEFFLQKNLLARELLPEENQVLYHQQKNDLTRIGRFLLDPALLPILENKLEQG